MYNFYTLYGKYCICSLSVVVLLFCGLILFRQMWSQYGVASDGGKAGFSQNRLWGEEPVIDARSGRYLQGQKVELMSMASARDINGDDLTGKLIFQDIEGNELSGYLNTERPGIYSLIIRVCSPLTGRESKKDVVVLIDGRVNE